MKRDQHRKYQYPIPSNPAPDGLKCYQILIPDDDEHRRLFTSAVRSLARWDSYNRDDMHTGRIAAATWRNALDYLNFDECGGGEEEEDTYADEYEALADGVMSMSQSGGLVKAIGYVIEEAGEFIVNTALPLIGLTLLAVGAAYAVSIIIGGVTIGSVVVGAAETVELIVSTGAAANIVEFTMIAALAA